MLVKQSHV